MRIKRTAVALAALSFLTGLAVNSGAAARAFTAKDLVMLDRISDPQLAPDGQAVVYSLRETDWDANRGRQLELGGNLAVELLAGRHGRIPPHRPASSLDRRHEWRDARAVSACVGNEYVSHFCAVPEGRAA